MRECVFLEKFRLASATTRKLALEFFNAPCRVNEALFARISRVRVRRNVTRNNEIFFAVNCDFFLGRKRGFRQKLATGRNVAKANVVDGRMNIFFHGKNFPVKFER